MQKLLWSIAITVSLLVPNLCGAKVLYASDSGFHIRIAHEVKADPAVAYAQFLRVGEWWNGDHTWFGDAKNLSIDPVADGCFCETAGDKSAKHMTVSYVDPERELRMTGGLGPLSGLGLHGAMNWMFEPLENGGTRIIHNYRVTGYYPEGLKGLSGIVDQVQTLQVSGLLDRLM